MIKVLSLDLWNTIIEDEVGPVASYGAKRVEALRTVLSRERPISTSELLETYLKLSHIREVVPPRLVSQIIAALSGYSPKSPIVEEATRAYEEAVYTYKPRVVEGSQRLLEYAKKRGLKVVVVSNTSFSARAVAKVLENAGLLQYIDYIVSSADTEVIKPNPRIFNAALRAVGAEPSEAVHLGDSCIKDAVGSYLVGMKPILLARDKESAELCKNLPSVVIVRSLNDALRVLEELTG